MKCKYFAEHEKMSPLNPYQAFCGHVGKIKYKDCLTCLRYEKEEQSFRTTLAKTGYKRGRNCPVCGKEFDTEWNE